MYNYGVRDNTYVIVMKRYTMSLKDYISKRKDHLQGKYFVSILTMFKEVLDVTKLLHDHNVTHYDIKADNILLDVDEENS